MFYIHNYNIYKVMLLFLQGNNYGTIESHMLISYSRNRNNPID